MIRFFKGDADTGLHIEEVLFPASGMTSEGLRVRKSE